jgi:cell division septation protein DedD
MMLKLRGPMAAALLVVPLCIAQASLAQTPTPALDADSAVFARAQVLVSAGEGGKGRAVVDSLLARTPSGSTRYAEGLFWRATLASNALDAERDYRRIAVEYMLSPRVPAALTRLAQLELARGDRTLARQHLERLLSEYPPQPERANAWYWLGRIAFESGDATRGCTAIDSARSLAGASDVELANQLATEARRCLTVDRSASQVSAAVPSGGSGAAAGSVPVRPTVAPARPPAKTAAGRFTIQVGAYPSRAAADQVRKRLAAAGYAVRVVPAGRYYRVRVGRYATRAAAAPVVKKLKAARNDAIVVSVESSQ